MKMENDLTRRELARYGGSALAGAYVAGLVDPDVPFANAARFTDGTPRTDLEFAMKFAHPEKLLGGFPGIDRLSDSAKAKLFGTSLRRYRAIRDGYRRNARRAAKQLLGDRSVATGVDRLPFKRGDTVVALGDSITDDPQSWGYILENVLRLRRGRERIKVVNAGISGDTTEDVISRFLGVVAEKPDWIITMISTNDARLQGRRPTKILVSHDETERNLAMIRNFATTQTRARLAWMTPSPVIEEKIERSRFIAPLQLIWRNSDLAVNADLIKALPDHVVDLQAAFGIPTPARLMDSDGLHPSLEGQKLIVKALVSKLSET